MNTICVDASGKYDVLVGSGILREAGSYIRSISAPCKVAIISDSNVFPMYGDTVSASLKQSGFTVFWHVFTAGEAQKNADTYFQILNFLAQNHFTRSDMLIALGGGVVGDMTGFVAATYLRGVSYVQIPTTLLAMVDSSVGGKTAIDLPAGKNLVGAFYQPKLVLCDIDALHSLPESIFADGCAEVIKYGVLYDPVLFGHLEENGKDFDKNYVITRCVELKKDVVKADEFDRGERQKLNLGHTIGHGIEAQSNFSVSHGQAVAIGMAIVSKASAQWELCNMNVHDRICRVLTLFKLPQTTVYNADALYESALSDKKRSGGIVNLIVPKKIGVCEIYPLSTEKVKSFIEAGL